MWWLCSAFLVGVCVSSTAVWMVGLAEVDPWLLSVAHPLPSARNVCVALGVGTVLLVLLVCRCRRNRQEALSPRKKIGLQANPLGDIARANTYPPPYPNGWYKVCDSEDLPIGETMHVMCCGEDLAVFRGEDGKAHVLHAYCPHAGANLGVGGVVKGNCIECPFHGWQFSGEDGSCTHIPYPECSSVPRQARTKVWPSLEMHSMILFYFDAEGRDPPYEPPVVPEIESGKWKKFGKWSRDMHMHIYDFSENSADWGHFNYLHVDVNVPLIGRFLTLEHVPGWYTGKLEDDEAHLSYFSTKTTLKTKSGWVVPKGSAEGMATFVGPGGLVYFRVETALGTIFWFDTSSPYAPMKLKNEKVTWHDPKIPRFLVKYVISNWISAFQDDIAVWQHKKFLRQPALAKGDGPIPEHRRWYRQFYSESSSKVGQRDLEYNGGVLDW